MRFEKLSYGNINFLPQLFENGWIIACVNIKDKYDFTDEMFFSVGLVEILIPSHVNRGAKILNTNKLFSKEKNSILISNNVNKFTSNTSRHLDLGFISGKRFF